MKLNNHKLNHEGYALISDLQSKDWSEIFVHLKEEQDNFLNTESSFRSEEYRWPRDALNNWSRIWEYPFAYHNLEKLRKNCEEGRSLKVADVGSGVTFFPFSVARLGYDVTCLDIDPICETDINKAVLVNSTGIGSVNVKLIKNRVIPLESESQDAVYCVSVLEHIPDFSTEIDEISRVLRKNGQFILTIDVDLKGNMEIGIEAFHMLQMYLAKHFEPAAPSRITHPADFLTTMTSPIKLPDSSAYAAAKRAIKSILNNSIWTENVSVSNHLAVFATVLKKI
jgi:2-polyprenyl-3-methyl-5-hydroxy-6-metoxy-1,4-benzoquinol methylase